MRNKLCEGGGNIKDKKSKSSTKRQRVKGNVFPDKKPKHAGLH